jgi:mRNA-degrading endonuclease RelE of RelBE toxin-antitoxin system
MDRDVDLAHALLRSRDLPALGIYLARAVIMTRKYDRDMLLDHIDETRDVQCLPLYDELEPVLAMLETAEAAQVYETHEAEKMSNLYQDLQERNREMERLRGELSEVRNDLKRKERRAAREIQAEARPVPTSQPARPETKYCKEEIKRLHNERNVLARQLRKLREARNLGKTPEPARVIEKEDVAIEDEEQVQHPVRIPLFSPAFTESIKRMPQQIAARAMALCGQLAAGESGSFHHVKRIKRHRDFYRAKVGDYRILLQLQEEALQVIDIFPRQDLERKLATLA